MKYYENQCVYHCVVALCFVFGVYFDLCSVCNYGLGVVCDSGGSLTTKHRVVLLTDTELISLASLMPV